MGEPPPSQDASSPRPAPPDVPVGDPGTPLADLFEDLEQQAAGLDLAERDAELADRARGEYATVTLAGRVHASLGRYVRLRLVDGTAVEGSLSQAGRDWCGLDRAARSGALVRFAAVATAEGLSPRAVPEAAQPAVARLGFGSALHRCAREWERIGLRLVGGEELPGRLRRVGADFVEVEPVTAHAVPGEATVVVPFSAVVSVWGR